MVDSFWKNKNVFLTGHTGFKGSWMSQWLISEGANLTGYSLGIPTEPSLFQELKIEKDMKSIFGDVRDLDKLKKTMQQSNPDMVIHMAAQPLVRYSYQEPVETYMTNVMGTVHMFESARACSNVKAILNVTSDKCYENREQSASYKETDAMGGHDPYSNSKGCSELVTSSYRNSFFDKLGVSVGSGRAGNVIGGGDWAADRLIPDIVRSVLEKKKLVIRNPAAIRPWQHVLEPVSGYLLLTKLMFTEGKKFAEGFNFGPSPEDHWSVEQIILKMNKIWQNKIDYVFETSDKNPHEAKLLSLDCGKAEQVLGWKPRWNLETALEKTVQWNESRLEKIPISKVVTDQIKVFQSTQPL